MMTISDDQTSRVDDGVRLVSKEQRDCKGCYYYDIVESECSASTWDTWCFQSTRNDKKSVIWVRAEDARPKANPSILLPGQRCRMHKYTDPRQRDAGNSYLIETRRGSS